MFIDWSRQYDRALHGALSPGPDAAGVLWQFVHSYRLQPDAYRIGDGPLITRQVPTFIVACRHAADAKVERCAQCGQTAQAVACDFWLRGSDLSYRALLVACESCRRVAPIADGVWSRDYWWVGVPPDCPVRLPDTADN
jgi:hypothetical protein